MVMDEGWDYHGLPKHGHPQPKMARTAQRPCHEGQLLNCLLMQCFEVKSSSISRSGSDLCLISKIHNDMMMREQSRTSPELGSDQWNFEAGTRLLSSTWMILDVHPRY